MDTRIWMQESFWESTEEQNVKESPQENAEHLSKDQNDGNVCDHAELSSIKLYPAFDRYFDDLSGTAEIKERKPMVSECIWACWDQTASYDISSDRWNIYRQGKNRSSRSLEDRFYSRWNLAAANFYLFLLRFNHRIKETW